MSFCKCVGRIIGSGQKRIVYDIDSIKEKLAGKKLAFKVQVVNKKVIKEKIKPVQKDHGGFLIMGTYSTIGMCGLKMGYVKKFGGYISYSDTFYDGMLNQWSATLGRMVRAASWLYPYVGAGFGWLYWPEYGGHYSYGMVPVEVGAMLKFGPVTLSAAVEPNYVFNKGVLCSFEFGVGFCF